LKLKGRNLREILEEALGLSKLRKTYRKKIFAQNNIT